MNAQSSVNQILNRLAHYVAVISHCLILKGGSLSNFIDCWSK